MTSLAAEPETVAPDHRRAAPAAQAYSLARRSTLSILRQPNVWFPSILFPLMIAAVNSAAFARAVDLPGFPETDSFLSFLLPATIAQGALFGSVNGGSDIALDIENGFFDRLLASPVWRPSILIGRLTGGSLLAGAQAILFTGILALFGARVQAGLPGVAVLVLMAIALAVAIGGVTATIGVRTGSQEVVQSIFPLMFILLFLSSAFFPTELMTGWYQSVAQANPFTWMIDAVRHLVLVGFDWSEAAKAIGIPSALAVGTIAMASMALRRRLASGG